MSRSLEEALTKSHPVWGADGALATLLERDSEPERHLGRNLREEGSEVPLHGSGGVRWHGKMGGSAVERDGNGYAHRSC